jgi:N-acetylglucosaminyldiphosphoundecaprenol N-acetyl-beta-D-mannosaminyltransferase
VLLSRVLNTPLPERVAGVDLTSAILRASEREGYSVYFLGGGPGVLSQAVARIRTRYPSLEIKGYASPRIDLDEPSVDEREALDALRDAAPDVLFLFLGTPKQEKWFARRVADLPPAVVLAVGGTVDLIAGTKRRAPRWLQSIGCEWLWRLGLEPRRLVRRYIVQDSRFVLIAVRELVTQYRSGERARRRPERPTSTGSSGG